jgi:hypothetical protein
MTYSIKGQKTQRLRITRPWKVGDPLLDIPTISIGKARKLLKGGLRGYLQGRDKLGRFKEGLKKVENGYEGPSATFFKE